LILFPLEAPLQTYEARYPHPETGGWRRHRGLTPAAHRCRGVAQREDGAATGFLRAGLSSLPHHPCLSLPTALSTAASFASDRGEALGEIVLGFLMLNAELIPQTRFGHTSHAANVGQGAQSRLLRDGHFSLAGVPACDSNFSIPVTMFCKSPRTTALIFLSSHANRSPSRRAAIVTIM